MARSFYLKSEKILTALVIASLALAAAPAPLTDNVLPDLTICAGPSFQIERGFESPYNSKKNEWAWA